MKKIFALFILVLSIDASAKFNLSALHVEPYGGTSQNMSGHIIGLSSIDYAPDASAIVYGARLGMKVGRFSLGLDYSTQSLKIKTTKPITGSFAEDNITREQYGAFAMMGLGKSKQKGIEYRFRLWVTYFVQGTLKGTDAVDSSRNQFYTTDDELKIPHGQAFGISFRIFRKIYFNLEYREIDYCSYIYQGSQVNNISSKPSLKEAIGTLSFLF